MYKEETFNIQDIDITPVKLVSLNGKLFDSEDEALEYLDTCDAELTTYNFYYERQDFESMFDKSELYSMANIDDEMEESEIEMIFDDMFFKYQEYVEDLIDEYEIDVYYDQLTSRGPKYTLSGKFENLKEFAKHYTSNFSYSNGELNIEDTESGLEKEIDTLTNIDIGSGKLNK